MVCAWRLPYRLKDGLPGSWSLGIGPPPTGTSPSMPGCTSVVRGGFRGGGVVPRSVWTKRSEARGARCPSGSAVAQMLHLKARRVELSCWGCVFRLRCLILPAERACRGWCLGWCWARQLVRWTEQEGARCGAESSFLAGRERSIETPPRRLFRQAMQHRHADRAAYDKTNLRLLPLSRGVFSSLLHVAIVLELMFHRTASSRGNAQNNRGIFCARVNTYCTQIVMSTASSAESR